MNHKMLFIINALNKLIALIEVLCIFLNANILYLIFKVILVSYQFPTIIIMIHMMYLHKALVLAYGKCSLLYINQSNFIEETDSILSLIKL